MQNYKAGKDEKLRKGKYTFNVSPSLAIPREI